MTTVDEMFNHWTDADFGYDREFDFWAQRRAIIRSDGVRLEAVSVQCSGAKFSAHFCLQAREIWLVEMRRFLGIHDLDAFEVAYSPRAKHHGLPTARGYLLQCEQLRPFALVLRMSDKCADYLRAGRDKSIRGMRSERSMQILVERDAFAPKLRGKWRGANFREDFYGGIDCYVGEDGVQVKFDGPGGSVQGAPRDPGRDPTTGLVRIMAGGGGTGFLFSQTHTLPLERAREWYDHDYKAEGHELPIAPDA